MRNHGRPFRPLVAGTEIFNPQAGDSGTLGFFLTDVGTAETWLVSCYHVLCRPNGAPAPSAETIFQGGVATGSEVALTDVARSDLLLDVALAKTTVPVSAWALGIGRIVGAQKAAVGMRVVKPGGTTGVTEGVIEVAQKDRITVAIPPPYPPDYDVCERGDSGSPWFEQSSGRIVAMHQAGSQFGPDKAFALPISRILDVTGLQLLT